MKNDDNMLFCEKCRRALQSTNFYRDRRGNPSKLCKKCLTMHLDPYNPETFVWILKDMDFPYVECEWNATREKEYEKNPDKMTGSTVLGHYISKMKLTQWNKYVFADSAKLEQEIEAKRPKKMSQEEEEEIVKANADYLKEQLDKGEISEAQYMTLVSTAIQREQNPPPPIDPTLLVTGDGDNPFVDGVFMDQDQFDLSEELTEEDKKYLFMKWGREFRPNEWIELERLYNEMISSFDIQDADTQQSLILINKAYLKMNQALNMGDIDGFQKLAKIYESLRKSCKFTAAQNKDKDGAEVDSVGELVAMCEREGFIPRYCTDIPQDKVDATLKDMNDYLYTLVTEDLGFGRQIENALKKIQIQNEIEKRTDEDDILNNDDFEEYYDEIESQIEQDRLIYKEQEQEQGDEET